MKPFDPHALPTVTSVSEHTKNVFFVFGTFPNGLKASIRLWPGSKFRGQSESSLLFRVRVSDKPGGALSSEDFSGLGFDRWTGGALFSEHRSISGAIRVQRTLRDESHRDEFLAKLASATADLEALLHRAFPTLAFSMQPEQFSALLADQAGLAFPLSDFEEEVAHSQVRILLGEGVQLISLVKVPGIIVHEAFQQSEDSPKKPKKVPDEAAPAKKPKKAGIAENLNDFAGL